MDDKYNRQTNKRKDANALRIKNFNPGFLCALAFELILY